MEEEEDDRVLAEETSLIGSTGGSIVPLLLKYEIIVQNHGCFYIQSLNIYTLNRE